MRIFQIKQLEKNVIFNFFQYPKEHFDKIENFLDNFMLYMNSKSILATLSLYILYRTSYFTIYLTNKKDILLD